MISSLSNEQIKHIRVLRSRKERSERGLFFIEGIRIVGEAIQTGAAIETLIVAPDLLTSPFAYELIGQAKDAGTSCIEVSSGVFQSLSQKDGPQGIGAVVRQRWDAFEKIKLTDDLWIALDEPRDPGNVGTIMRVGQAVNATGLVLIGEATDPYDPASVRAGMGALFSTRLARTNWDQFALWKYESGVTVVGATGGGAQDYQSVRYSHPMVLLMGSEREGLSDIQKQLCDVTVRIPMVGRVDSLNLAMATGIILYEIFNQSRS